MQEKSEHQEYLRANPDAVYTQLTKRDGSVAAQYFDDVLARGYGELAYTAFAARTVLAGDAQTLREEWQTVLAAPEQVDTIVERITAGQPWLPDLVAVAVCAQTDRPKEEHIAFACAQVVDAYWEHAQTTFGIRASQKERFMQAAAAFAARELALAIEDNRFTDEDVIRTHHAFVDSINGKKTGSTTALMARQRREIEHIQPETYIALLQAPPANANEYTKSGLRPEARLRRWAALTLWAQGSNPDAQQLVKQVQPIVSRQLSQHLPQVMSKLKNNQCETAELQCLIDILVRRNVALQHHRLGHDQIRQELYAYIMSVAPKETLANSWSVYILRELELLLAARVKQEAKRSGVTTLRLAVRQGLEARKSEAIDRATRHRLP